MYITKSRPIQLNLSEVFVYEMEEYFMAISVLICLYQYAEQSQLKLMTLSMIILTYISSSPIYAVKLGGPPLVRFGNGKLGCFKAPNSSLNHMLTRG